MKRFREVNHDISDDCEEDKFLESETNSEDAAREILPMELTQEDDAPRVHRSRIVLSTFSANCSLQMCATFLYKGQMKTFGVSSGI
ncbi:hypothetical protein HHI36_019286 [Cryptolaemus montrouzieri]|uniref:Uncharacterized protein n=1 Tax=Cryptolaemus montrouzieri TaxID=559131 RepID=A0ABD2P3C0_9CUCU